MVPRNDALEALVNLDWYNREEVQALARRFRIAMQPPKKVARAGTVVAPPLDPFSPGALVLAGPEGEDADIATNVERAPGTGDTAG